MELKLVHKAPKVRSTVVFPTCIRTQMAQSKIDKGLIDKNMIVEPEDVAERIVKQVLSGESGGQLVIQGALR